MTDQHVTCPMCHTGASLTSAALQGGESWRCVRCGQHWDAGRVAAVLAYAVWAEGRTSGRPQHQQ